jgi:GAF domain-containing protein
MRVLARHIASTSSLAEVLSMAAHTVRQHLGYEQVAIYLAEPDTGDLTLCAVAVAEPSQVPPAQYHLPRGEGTPGQAVAQGKSVRLRGADFTPALGLAAATESSVPIWEDGRPIGALTVASSRPARAAAPAGAGDEEVLALLADQLAAAIRSAELSRREAERAGREELLTHIGQAVNSSLDLGEVLQQAVVKVGAALKADRCTLGQIDLAARVLITRHEYVSPVLYERRSLKGQMALEASLAGLAEHLQAGEVIISAEGSVHPVLHDVWGEFSGRYGIRSLAWVPILGQSPDRSYSLALMQLTHPRRWSDADVALLRAIADQLALALHNARLFDAVQQSARELQAKNEELESCVYNV